MTLLLALLLQDWPQWRGPSLNGVSDAKGLPTSWSETENVAWKVKLPSWSGSTPIIAGDRIFVTSPSAGSEAKNVKAMGGQRKPEGLDILLLCLSKKDGAELWRSTIAGANYQIGKQNMSSPSPVTDGKHVWWLTGTGHLTALTVEGKQVWQVELQKAYGKFGLNWGYGASPLLYEGLVIVPVMHGMTTDEPSYLVAFDGVTGKEVWRENRVTDAENESPDAYTTVYPMKVGDHVELILIAGDYFSGHDPKTGKELWRAGGLNPKKDKWFRAVSSPVIAGDVVVGCIKKAPVVAVKVGGKGDVTATHTAWTSDAVYDVPTPVFDGTRLYILDDGGFVSCLDPKTGQALYKKERLPKGTYSASPLLADGKIYVTSERGRTTVFEAGAAFKILAENQLDDDYTLSSIAVSGSQLFIRTSSALYCVGKK
ncbi:MAG TPA: PQQ-binding-like beta-propeller repeat protein [Planctomycetota bacterium]